jgi:hypothetical protein
LALASVGCLPAGGGGSSGGNNNNNNNGGNRAGAPAYDVTGTWDMSVEAVSTSGVCGDDAGDSGDTVLEFTQTGTQLRLTFPGFDGQFIQGSISGSQISWGGTVSTDGGELTFTGGEMYIRSATFMDGSVNWRMASEEGTCNGTSRIEGQARRSAIVLGGGDGSPGGPDDTEPPVEIEDDFELGTCADVCEALFGEFLPEESRDCIGQGIFGAFPEVFDACENPETRSDCTACLRTVGAGDGECREIANSCVGLD